MQTYMVGLIALAILFFLIVMTGFSWRRRAKAQSRLVAEPSSAFSGIDEEQRHAECFYVATTFTEDSLKRIVAHGLAHRGKAVVSVSNMGLLVDRVGERSVAIPKECLLGLETTSAVIDKAVETDGLIAIDWILGEAKVTTFLRFTSAPARTEFLQGTSFKLDMELRS
jgi:hypothetical protein